MDSKLKDLQERKNTLATEIKALGDKQAEWTDEHRSQWDKLNKDYDEAVAAIKTRRDELLNAEAVQKRLKEIEDQNKAINNDRGGGFDGDKRRELDPEHTEQRTLGNFNFTLRCILGGVDLENAEHRSRFAESRSRFGITRAADGPGWDIPTSYRSYGKPAWTTNNGLSVQEREFRAGLDVATSGEGKETIPQGFMYELEKKTLEYGHVRQVCRVIQTPTGNSMPWPVVDDTSNEAAILAEATTISTSVDPTFSAITFLAYKLSSKPVFASAEIIQDSAFNLAAEIGGLIGERFSRGESTYETTGTNSSQPQGVVNGSGTGVTAASATAFTADELIKLVHSLDPSYRRLPSVGWMMKDDVLSYVRRFKDANGQYLWQPGMQPGVPDRLYGFPVAVNQKMTGLTSDAPVTATKHVLFAAFEKYVIRDVGGIRLYRLDERYRDTDQTAFIAFKRFDARYLNTAAAKALLQA